MVYYKTMSRPEKEENEEVIEEFSANLPKPDSNQGIVFLWHQEGLSRTEMKERHLLSNLQINLAYKVLYRKGLIPKPTEEQKKELQREGQRLYSANPPPD